MNRKTEEPSTISWLQVCRIEDDRIAEMWMLYALGLDWSKDESERQLLARDVAAPGDDVHAHPEQADRTHHEERFPQADRVGDQAEWQAR